MLAIIPARGGSKGLPGKNTKLLCGSPLIEYTIKAALKSKQITKVLVSTDSKEIADIALEAGAEVPFLRPVELATDDALAIDNYIYTCDRMMTEGNGDIENFVVLQPTSPLRTTEDIDSAVNLFFAQNADSVISVTENEHPIYWSMVIDDSGRARHFFEHKNKLSNRQELIKTYIPNGAIYVFNYKFLKKESTYYSDNTFAYTMPKERSIDIDDSFDFKLAEFLMERMKCDE